MKKFGGKILFLDRSDINTDEIIPARYLTEITKEALKPHLLEDLDMKGFSASKDIQGKEVVVSRANFGCGSSREHAPWAFEVNGINVVVAENFARIFRQNMFNCGMLAIELEKSILDSIFDEFLNTECEMRVDFWNSTFEIFNSAVTKSYSFTLTGFDRELVKEGGWVEFADKRY